jgi:hypothetical protein
MTPALANAQKALTVRSNMAFLRTPPIEGFAGGESRLDVMAGWSGRGMDKVPSHQRLQRAAQRGR